MVKNFVTQKINLSKEIWWKIIWKKPSLSEEHIAQKLTSKEYIIIKHNYGIDGVIMDIKTSKVIAKIEDDGGSDNDDIQYAAGQ